MKKLQSFHYIPQTEEYKHETICQNTVDHLLATFGVTAAMEPKKVRIAIPGWEKDTVNYVSAIERLGGQPVLIWDEYDPKDFDGLLLPGGKDISPDRYGQENIACKTTDPELDEVQFAAADRFIQAGLPVLGICRGHQLLNIYFGGTLIQDLDNAAEHTKVDQQDNINQTVILADSFLAPIYGSELSVNSAHHQAIDRLAEGLRIVQWAGHVAEAMEHEHLPVYGVQWHPERMCFDFARPETGDGSKLLAWFLSVCQKNK